MTDDARLDGPNEAIDVAAAALVIDARGTHCPVPIIRLAKRIGEIDVGAVAVVLSDDPASRHDVPAWCSMRGHDYVGESEVDGIPAYAVRRTT